MRWGTEDAGACPGHRRARRLAVAVAVAAVALAPGGGHDDHHADDRHVLTAAWATPGEAARDRTIADASSRTGGPPSAHAAEPGDAIATAPTLEARDQRTDADRAARATMVPTTRPPSMPPTTTPPVASVLSDGAPVDPTGTTSTTSSTTSPAVAAVRSQRGFALWSWTADGYASASARAALDSLVAIGADSVAFVPLYFVDTVEASTVVADPTVTASRDALRAGIAAARARGLRVTVRPLIDVRTGAWRGDIAPLDRASWFASYRRIVNDLTDLATAGGADQMVVGTELHTLSRDAASWRAVIADVRTRFDGSVSYAALPFEWEHIVFWDALDVIGINAWSPLAAGPTTDVAALTRAWEAELDRYEAAGRRWDKPVLITEAGFTSQRGTATAPWRWDLSTVHAPDEQAAGYRALLDAMADEPWLIGVHWWAWRVTDRAEPLDFTPQGGPAEAVVRDRWR